MHASITHSTYVPRSLINHLDTHTVVVVITPGVDLYGAQHALQRSPPHNGHMPHSVRAAGSTSTGARTALSVHTCARWPACDSAVAGVTACWATSHPVATRRFDSQLMRCTARKAFPQRKPLLFRKMEQSRREGSRHRRAVHFHGCGPKAGTADGYPPVPIEGAVSIARRVEEHCAPSAHTFLQRPQCSHASMPVTSRRRCHRCH